MSYRHVFLKGTKEGAMIDTQTCARTYHSMLRNVSASWESICKKSKGIGVSKSITMDALVW